MKIKMSLKWPWRFHLEKNHHMINIHHMMKLALISNDWYKTNFIYFTVLETTACNTFSFTPYIKNIYNNISYIHIQYTYWNKIIIYLGSKGNEKSLCKRVYKYRKVEYNTFRCLMRNTRIGSQVFLLKDDCLSLKYPIELE